ncbi:MAG: SAM-dependent chlorinase/fluorinase [Saprospiraceae bacterium]|nr:SAM-dependent chlorinase/fluorinase [Saprospiraceae bacterium]
MNVVTLTSDFGRLDYFAGVIKGSILSHGMPVIFADITHDIENYNIVQASYIVKNSYASFPKGSIHLISVNIFYKKNPRFLAIKHNGHYFIGPDNGVFSLMFGDEINQIYNLNNNSNESKLEVREIYSKAVGHILHGNEFHEIGIPVNEILERISILPITGKDQIRGSVIHIDNYKNVVLNINRKLFERIGQKRAFELYFKRYDPINKISQNYADVPIGEVLCLFNSAGLLEIAVNLDKAATLFGLEVDEAIQIDFFNRDN